MNDGGPAFPYGATNQNKGMTLRDYFAAKALQGICSNPMVSKIDTDLNLAHQCYVYADAMLAERERKRE